MEGIGNRDELVACGVERDLAKAERRRTRWTQPKLGKLEEPLPKPVLASKCAQGEAVDEIDECDHGGSVDDDGLADLTER
ncbi:hypothetical protein BDN67DRAFT_974269 [Paxillus ammoniavirescens]|nr:hypothetical protein BDN67DRAFT_974269 [Paxillus ammoniavirescens]